MLFVFVLINLGTMLKTNPWVIWTVSMVTLQVTEEMETGCGEEVIYSPQYAAKYVHCVYDKKNL